jgi:RHS repeat-associated protein
MTYYPGCLLHTFQTPNGYTSTMTYDGLGRLHKDTDDTTGGYTLLERTDVDHSYNVTLTTALSRKTTHKVEHLPSGDERRTITFPDGISTELLIGADGNRKTTFPDGTITNLLEGPDPRFSMQAPLSKSLSITTGGVTSTVTAEHTATFTDPLNPLSLTVLNESTSINNRPPFTRSFNTATKVLTETTAAGRQRTMTVDAQGRVLQTHVSGLFPVDFTYYTNGKLHTITQGTGMQQRSANFVYDTSGNTNGYLHTMTVAAPSNPTFTFQADATGRIHQTTLPDNAQIITGYDGNGYLNSITPPGLPAHAIDYNSFGQISQYTPPQVPGTGSTVYDYNADRQLKLVTRPGSATIAFDYPDCCLHTVTIARGTYIFTKDPITGHLATITAPDGGMLANSYNGAWLSTATWSGLITGSVSQTPDNNLRVATMSVNGGQTISFTYDDDGLVTQVGNSQIGNMIVHRDAQKDGVVNDIELGNESDVYDYNLFGELTGITTKYNGQTLFSEQCTKIDTLGRVTEKIETVAGVTTTWNYQYDSAGRLWIVQENGSTVATYTYDSNGNRKSGPGLISPPTYDAQDRLIQYGNATYHYSPNGELDTKVSGQNTTYSYDELGNLLSVTKPNGTFEYVVDGLNRRIGKKVNQTLVKGFLYQDRLRPIAELDGNSIVVSRFVYATGRNVPDYMVRNNVTYRIVTDRLGSVRLVVNLQNGKPAQQIDYDEFGNVTHDSNAGFQPFGFAGGLYDPDTHLIRFGARDYDAETGRWMAKDPVRFRGGDTNLYVYGKGNPLQYTDPTGTCIEDACVGEIALLVAAEKAIEPELPALETELITTVEQLKALGWQFHHWFPEQFENEFAEIGIDVQEFTTAIPGDFHRMLHSMGWNAAWEAWLAEAEELGYDASNAVEYLYELLQPHVNALQKAGITGPNGFCSIVPYPQ